MNSFGRMLRISSWGESHGAGIGVLIDGLPAGLEIDFALLSERLAARQGGGLGTPRREADAPEILAGVAWQDGGGAGGAGGAGGGAEGARVGRSTGDPIALFVRNTNTRSGDYDDVIRPAHADGTWRVKFSRPLGAGGGRASARESVAKVIAGAFAAMLLRRYGVRVYAALEAVGALPGGQFRYNGEFSEKEAVLEKLGDWRAIGEEEFAAAAAAREALGLNALGDAAAIKERIEAARKVGDSLGGSVRVGIFGAPAGLGEVLYDRLDARLAQALMGLNAVKAVEIGAGALLATSCGSVANDEIASSWAFEQFRLNAEFSEKSAVLEKLATAGQFHHNAEISENPADLGKLGGFATCRNLAGGILGGLSTGESIQLRVHFKPTPSIAREQVIALPDGRLERRCLRGRHDPCVAVRGCVVALSLAELVLADFMLLGACANVRMMDKIYKEK